MVSTLLSNAAVAAAYLRRLGFAEKEAVKLVESRPLKGGQNKQVLSDLVSRHVLRIPFENLEQHPLPTPGAAATEPTPVEERLGRLATIRSCVERLAFGVRGGVCFDLNLPFAWLLRELGASARIAMAQVATAEGFDSEATHCVIIVDLENGPVLVDPGFGDPPRMAVPMDGGLQDSLASYEVCDDQTNENGFSKVLKRRRDAQSLSRHIQDLDDSALDKTESDWTPLYAFRPADDLQYDNQELKAGLERVLTPGATLFSAKKFVCLGTAEGYVVLSEKRLRRVEGSAVVEEVTVEGDEAAWQDCAGRIFGMPLLSPPPALKAKEPENGRSSALTGAYPGKMSASRAVATASTKGLGTIDAKSLAVGGAGAGGGLGLNKPGFGLKVQHFAGSAGKKTIDIGQEIQAAWQSVVDDSDPTMWIYCTYTSDGKGLELAGKGSDGLKEFKEQCGDNIAWGGFRCYGVDKRGGLVCKRPKFVFVQHKPESASAIKKAKQGSHKGDVKEAIHSTHLDLTVENLDDLDEQVLITKLQAATGAHKPNGYEFNDGEFVEADFYGLGIGKQCKGETSKS
eukprot:gb/GFBE01046000.1/.p1 GENE.gb/GFBE01046000.1/~~gb/GFBE01046000.1/.p1  ORF type:complete len:569 (+),score=136.09 gb/GFBE01046000.1/:1-1707(+)